jgi:hypothetical protein
MDMITRRAEQWFRSVMSDATPEPREVQKWVDKLRQKFPGRSSEELAWIAVDKVKWKVWLIAIVAGAFSNPLLCVLLAWIETKKIIKWQVETAAKIAGIFEPELLLDRAEFEGYFLSVMMPQAVDEPLEFAARAGGQAALGAAVSHVGRHATHAVIRRVVAKDLLKHIKRFAIRYLGVKVTQRAILSKAVPVAGIVVGVVMNHYEINKTGREAIKHFTATRAAASVELVVPTA